MDKNISPKIAAAITSAINAYREEKSHLYEVEEARKICLLPDKVNMWAMAGRHEAAFQRRLWQMRMY